LGIYFIDHAEERFIERRISIRKIRHMLKKGKIIDDIGHKFGRKVCIYKEGNKYYSIVFQPCREHKIVITGYQSKEWEKRIYKGPRK
jgi:hypothetical protein